MVSVYSHHPKRRLANRGYYSHHFVILLSDLAAYSLYHWAETTILVWVCWCLLKMKKARKSLATWRKFATNEKHLKHYRKLNRELSQELTLQSKSNFITKNFCRDILTRIIDCIQCLIPQNLALRGREESVSFDEKKLVKFLSANKLVAQCAIQSKNTFNMRKKRTKIFFLFVHTNLSTLF